MSKEIEQNLQEIVLSLVKGIKVLVQYILPSILVAIIFIPDLGYLLVTDRQALVPFIINAVILALVTYFKPKYDALQAEYQKRQELG